MITRKVNNYSSLFIFDTTMWYQLKSYIQFLYVSKNQHGVHSPFVYDLITRCFYDPKKKPVYNTLLSHREKLLQRNDPIEITDFGAGSKVFSSNYRKINALVKNAGISKKKQALLFRVVNYFNSGNILELGTSLGLATIAMALGNPNSKVTTIEGCPNTAKIAQHYFNSFQLKNITLINTSFDLFFRETTKSIYNLVYVDGNHDKEKTLSYFSILVKHINNDSVLIFDDIYWSSEMTEAWKEIIQHPKVTVSIDTFYWGIVLFRKEQEKEHFIIRV